jgi:glycosyltransferase involved in cell wall biosynthesis
MNARPTVGELNDTRSPFAPHRNALDFFPDGIAPRQPTVAIVVPLYNEIDHVHGIVKQILDQTYEGIHSIWLVDGCSQDGTAEEIDKLAQTDPRITVHRNAKRVQAAAINSMFSREETDIVMRLDAHAQYDHAVVERCVNALLRTGAGGVGAVARPLPATTRIGKSIVAVHESRLGVGVASFRGTGNGCWTDTVWNGCYWRHVVQEVGPFREDLQRTEDNDFNARVRQCGFGLYLDPTIHAYYFPRQTLGQLWSQYFATGAGVMSTYFIQPQAVSLRHLAPFFLVAGLLVPLLLACVWPSLILVFCLFFSIYLLAIFVISAATWLRNRRTEVCLLPITFATLHLSYGFGSVWGLIGRLRCFVRND